MLFCTFFLCRLPFPSLAQAKRRWPAYFGFCLMVSCAERPVFLTSVRAGCVLRWAVWVLMGWGGVGTGRLTSAGTVVLPSVSSTPSWIARIISSVQSRGYIPWDWLCTKMLKATHSPETSVPPLLLVESRRHVSLPWRPALQADVASRSLLWC